MTREFLKTAGVLFLAGTMALAGCKGADGKDGATGATGATVPAPAGTVVTAFHGVAAGGVPWVLDRGSVRLKRDGIVNIVVAAEVRSHHPVGAERQPVDVGLVPRRLVLDRRRVQVDDERADQDRAGARPLAEPRVRNSSDRSRRMASVSGQ